MQLYIYGLKATIASLGQYRISDIIDQSIGHSNLSSKDGSLPHTHTHTHTYTK